LQSRLNIELIKGPRDYQLKVKLTDTGYNIYNTSIITVDVDIISSMSSTFNTIFLDDDIASVYPKPSQVTSIFEDDESFVSKDLLSMDGDSDNCSDSSDLLSYESDNPISQTSHICPNTLGAFDTLSQLPSYATSFPDSHFSQPSQSSPHPLLHDSSNFSAQEVNDLGETHHFRENNQKLECTSSSSSFVDLNNIEDLNRCSSEDSEIEILQIGKRRFEDSTSITCDSTLSLTSSMGSAPIIICTDQCLGRSQQRSTSTIVPTSSLSEKSDAVSHYSNSLQESSMSSPPITSTSLLIDSSSIASHKLTPVVVHRSGSSSSLVTYETHTTDPLVEKLMNDVSQPSSQVDQLKREIRYYRQRCVRSSTKCMMHYSNLYPTCDSTNDCNDSSIGSDLYLESSHTKIVSSAAIEIMGLILVLFIVYMLWFLLSLSNIGAPLTT